MNTHIDTELQQRPIPPYEAMTAMPILENQEELVNLLDSSTRIVSLMTQKRMDYQGINRPQLLLRETVAEKLLLALDNLKENEGLGIYDAHRPNSVQQIWYETELAEIKINNPDWSSDRCIDEVKRWLSPAQTNPSLPPSPHSTGGAVDLNIVKINQDRIEPLDVGSHHSEWSPKSWTHSQEICREARINRNRLQGLMASVGMVNYSGEWWHYSYGDSYWAVTTKAKQAIYGRVE